MQRAAKIIDAPEHAEAQTLDVLEHAAVVLFLVGLVLVGVALPYL